MAKRKRERKTTPRRSSERPRLTANADLSGERHPGEVLTEEFLARDIAAGSVQVVTPELAARVKSLVEDVHIDLEAPLAATDE